MAMQQMDQTVPGDSSEELLLTGEQTGEIVTIDHLQNEGINVADIKKLKEAGLSVPSAILMCPLKELLSIKGLSEAKLSKIREAALRLCPNQGIISAKEFHHYQLTNGYFVSTGVPGLDQILKGGYQATHLTEIFGEYRTGKSQIQPEHPGKVLYLDTEGGFTPSKIERIAERFGVDGAEVLDNITYARVYTSDHQYDILVGLAARLSQEHHALIIVDSVTALFRVDYSGRGELSERQQKLNKFLSKLRKLTIQFNTACILTNQVMSDPSGGSMFVSDPKKAVGGHILAHASSVRVQLRKGRNEQRIAKIISGLDLAEQEATFDVTDAGVGEACD